MEKNNNDDQYYYTNLENLVIYNNLYKNLYYENLSVGGYYVFWNQGIEQFLDITELYEKRKECYEKQIWSGKIKNEIVLKGKKMYEVEIIHDCYNYTGKSVIIYLQHENKSKNKEITYVYIYNHDLVENLNMKNKFISFLPF